MSRVVAQQTSKVTVYDAVTGAPLSRWSVDAEELVRVGAATWAPPAVEDASVASDASAVDDALEEPAAETAPEPEARPKRKR